MSRIIAEPDEMDIAELRQLDCDMLKYRKMVGLHTNDPARDDEFIDEAEDWLENAESEVSE